MKHNLLKSIIISVILLMGVSNAWGKIIYLKPNSNWKNDNARFAIWTSDDKWYSTYHIGNDFYAANIADSGWKYVIFCRMNSSSQDNNWSNKWNQSGDISINDDPSKNCFEIAGDGDCGKSINWYTIDWYIKGNFNEWGNGNKFEVNNDLVIKEDITLEKGQEYTFKLNAKHSYSNSDLWWYSNTGNMTRGNSKDWSMSNVDNCTITADKAGTYTFAYDIVQQKLTVYYPYKYSLAGNFNNWKLTDYSLENGNTSVNLESGDYEFKVFRNNSITDEPLGNTGDMQRNNNVQNEGWVLDINVNDPCGLNADIDGAYNFIWDASQNKIKVQYPQQPYFLAGSWDGWKAQPSIANTPVTIHLDKGNYSFKIFNYQTTAEYYGKAGEILRTNCTNWTMENMAEDCRIYADISGDYTFTFNKNTKQLTVTYPEYEMQTIYLDLTQILGRDGNGYTQEWYDNKAKITVKYDNQDYDLTPIGCDLKEHALYSCEIPKEKNVEFVRYKENKSEIWNTCFADGTHDARYNCFKVTEWNSGEWTTFNEVYPISLDPSTFGTYSVKYNGKTYTSSPTEEVIFFAPSGAQIEVLPGKTLNDAYGGGVLVQRGAYNDIIKNVEGNTIEVCGRTSFDDLFVTKESHIVYLAVPDDIKNNWQDNDDTNISIAYAQHEYNISKGAICQCESPFPISEGGVTYYKFIIPEGWNNFRFELKKEGDHNGYGTNPINTSIRFPYAIPTSNVNCYTLTNYDGNEYSGTWGTLPALEGDYRLLYVEQVVEKSKKDGDEWKTIITRKKAHPSNIIRKRTESGVDTVSLHTYKDRKYAAKLEDGSTYESSNNPEIILQKYLGNDQWQDVECQMVYGPLETLPIMANLPGRKNASPSSNIDDLQHQDGIENIKKDVLNHQDKGNGVWNFVVTQDNAGNASVQWNETHRYTGEYYIRTDNAEGGWDQYTLNDNYMTYSQYAKDHSGFSHYFCRWVEKNITPNTKFVIANDHGVAISDTLSGDQFTDIHGNIQEDANIRWSWNMVNNEIARAYIQGTWKAGSQERNRNLVVNYKPSSEGAVEDLLDDSGDWIYQKDFPVKVGSHLNSLTAQYPVSTGSTQTFASNLDMLTGDPAVNDKDYKVRILYDFKINKTLVALVPNANEASIAIDVVIERINQGEATQVQAPIAYSNNQRSGEGSTVYGVMSFDKSHLTDPSLSSQQKLTYWISFPFDVKLSEIFGFGEVGDYWMIKYYDGKDRAAKGLYDDNTFWKFITNRNYTLKANQGYVLALNKKVMDANSPIFTNTTRISLYFPSKEKLLNINTDYTQTTCTIPEYTCTITSPTDRRTKDSNWNFIGVPSFANKNRNTTNENLKYFYDYDYLTDTYSVAINRNSRENTFKSMFAYMVQFAGTIDWSTLASNGSQGLAAKKTDNVEKHVLRIELQQNNTKVDQTYIQLEDEEVTAMFDMNYDLTKLFNSKTNIYSLIPSDTDPIQVAANVMPIEETIIPLGIKLDAAGEYTFAMPDGTDGIVVELIDYDNNTRTNMLLDEYTVNLGKGTFENRFALHVKPNKTTTSVEDINTNTTGVKKYLIDGVLYMQKDGVLYDAQGKLVR